MRIRTKALSGYLILIALLLLVQLYQITLIRQMLRINEYVSRVNFKVGQESAALQRDLEEFSKFAEKYLAVGDPRYAEQLRSMRVGLDGRMKSLTAFDVSSSEAEAIEDLTRLWDSFRNTLYELENVSRLSPQASNLESLLPLFRHRLTQASAYTERIAQANQQAAVAHVMRLEAMGDSAGLVSLGVVGIGLALSLLLSLMVVRSISKPLGQLMRGTREIAGGDFSVVIDEAGKDELSELGTHFNFMVRKLSELDQLKKDFVSHVSHELKAPLASMQETTKLLLEGIPGDLNDQQRHLLKLNLGSTERLFKMIKNLLDLSSIDAGAMHYHFEEKDVLTAVLRAVDEYHGLCLEKKVRVEVLSPDQPIMVRVDEERFVQVVGNLIANAISFSPEEELVRIEVRQINGLPKGLPEDYQDRISSSPAGFCVISVYDRGPGVPDRVKERIFQHFFVMEKVRKETGENTGLGLAISRKITSAHSGAIWIEDNPGGGSVFSLLFPALEAR